MVSQIVVGLDIGQRRDFSGIVVLEAKEQVDAARDPITYDFRAHRDRVAASRAHPSRNAFRSNRGSRSAGRKRSASQRLHTGCRRKRPRSPGR